MVHDMNIVELDAVAGFAHTALTPLETQRYQKMGDRRRKSFLAARMVLKNLYRRSRNNDTITPAHQIETVRKDSPLPFARCRDSSGQMNCSISHDRRFAIGVVDRQAVGVDVEVISPKAFKADHIFMNTTEQKLVRHSTMEETSAAVRIWSIKETVAKAMGMNLADAWARVTVIAVNEIKSEFRVGGDILTAQHVTVDEHLFTLVSLCADA
jgi:phosphopantetheinyl transferase